VGRKARSSGYLPMEYAPSVGRVRAVKSPSFTARFLCLIEQAGPTARKSRGGGAVDDLDPNQSSRCSDMSGYV
jgi:hypothetical protein